MADLILVALNVGLGLAVLLTTFFVGRLIEKRHLLRLAADEAELAGILVTDLRRTPDNWETDDASLVVGEAVIAADRWKRFLAGWKKLVGGRLRMYEAIMDRGRRQARVRMLRQAQEFGANAVWNVRFETCHLGDERRNKKGGAMAIICYGTALKVR